MTSLLELSAALPEPEHGRAPVTPGTWMCRAPVGSLWQLLSTNTDGRPGPASAGGRVLSLSGTWHSPSDRFTLEAMLAVGPDGTASGPIWWKANRVPPLEGIEDVRGAVVSRSVELDGVNADRGLACDRYRITLSGDDDRGTFAGISWAFGSWNGRLEGTYRFRDDTGSRT